MSDLTSFFLDMNIKILDSSNQLQIGKLQYSDIYTLFCNKLYVVSTPKVYRRVKDFYDIYSILKSNQIKPIIDPKTLIQRFKSLYHIDNQTPLEFFKEEFYPQLKHAYLQNSLFNEKEPFDDFFQDITKFIQIFYMKCLGW